MSWVHQFCALSCCGGLSVCLRVYGNVFVAETLVLRLSTDLLFINRSFADVIEDAGSLVVVMKSV